MDVGRLVFFYNKQDIGGEYSPEKLASRKEKLKKVLECYKKMGFSVVENPRDASRCFEGSETGVREAALLGFDTAFFTRLYDFTLLLSELKNKKIICYRPEAKVLTSDKMRFKNFLSKNEIFTPKYHIFTLNVIQLAQKLKEEVLLAIEASKISYPLIIKPCIGSESRGVCLVENEGQTCNVVKYYQDNSVIKTLKLTENKQYLLEEYCQGDELAIIIMPPDKANRFCPYESLSEEYWALKPIKTPLQKGLRARQCLEHEQEDPVIVDEEIKKLVSQCVKIATLMNAALPMKFDCRLSVCGQYAILDGSVSMNLRFNKSAIQQSSLLVRAIYASGMDYETFLKGILQYAWTVD